MATSLLLFYLPQVFFAAAILYPIFLYLYLFLRNPRPSSLPWSPSGKRGMLASLYAPAQCLRDMRGSLLKGQEISSNGSGFLISSLLDGVVICLPLKCYKWWGSQPGTALSWIEGIKKIFQFHYTIPCSNVEQDFDTVRYEDKILRRNALTTVPAVYEEIKDAFGERQYSLPGQEWSTICLWEEMVRIISPAANRMLVGPTLCRDDAYLKTMSTYIMGTLPCAFFLHCCPAWSQRFFGKLIAWYRHRKFERSLIAKVQPLVESRLSIWREKSDLKDNTFLSWWITEAPSLISRSKTVLNVDLITSSVIGINIAGLHTTSTMTTTVWYYVLTYEHAQDLMEQLREEIRTVFTNMDGGWTSAKLDQLLLLDSVIRETLRHNPPNDASTSRLALQKLTTPDGLTIQPGSFVVVPAININMDPDYYQHPAVWNPYRHLGRQEGTVAASATATSEHYVSFGHAYHACPGRWFAVNVIKMIFIEMLMNFEIESIPTMPTSIYLGTMRVVSTTQKIRLRHRSGKY